MKFIPNFIIYADIPSESMTIDPDTGNMIASTTILEIKAWMKQRSPRSDSDDYTKLKSLNPSIDHSQVYLAGYCVLPKLLPPEILVQRKQYDCVYIEPLTDYMQKGKFILSPQVNENRPRVAKALARAMGTEIQGIMEFGYGS